MEKVKSNVYGIKVGDIFVYNHTAYSNDIPYFYKVEALKGQKQVIIREIEKEIVERDKDNQYVQYVMPNLAKYVTKRSQLKDNINGEVRLVTLDKYNNPYIVIRKVYGVYSEEAYLWDGNKQKYYMSYLP